MKLKGTQNGGTNANRETFRVGLIKRLVCFGCVMLVICVGIIWKLSDLKSEAKALDLKATQIKEQIEEERSKQLEALREMAIYDSNAYLEKKARSSFNLIREGDKIIVIKSSK